MKKTLISMAISIAALLPTLSHAALTAEQQQQLDSIHQLLTENPEIIGDLQLSLQQYVEGQKQLENAKKQSESWLNDTTIHTVLGNTDGSTVIVNFTDYNCPYCKRLDGELTKLVANYKDLKVINIYVPLKQQVIEGLDTNSAAFAIKVWQQAPEKFVEVNRLLVAKPGIHTKDSIEAIAKKTDTTQYLTGDTKINESLVKNYKTFVALGLRGTPAMFIGDELIPGYVPYDKLEQVIKKNMAENAS
ncbi:MULTISPECIES: DsbA family protein [Vibrio]|uniref:DsbA family protein n=1 Tax=Vibrio TaxID=662 RepID=UPI0004DD349B|nr:MULTISPECIES: DsbA family protein [Vibrio]KFA98149.1 protein-disulfide isomerase [Vibrio sp. ER1A]MDA0107148.1 DsbA family protein [Vibrio sp. La 4.2.2]NOH28913.1 DsbA family protein [Vibrio mediterranei]NUW75407.1 DsbA family protein [Vibrio mediterranei]USE03850.1 DsbA family protein [Vibrio sp. SCSIO 43133]